MLQLCEEFVQYVDKLGKIRISNVTIFFDLKFEYNLELLTHNSNRCGGTWAS